MGRSRAWIVIALAATLCVAYAGYWFWLVGRLQTVVTEWVAARRLDGVQIRYEVAERVGFPLRAALAIRQLSAARTRPDPAWQWRAQADTVIVALPVYRFDRLVVEIPGPSRMWIRDPAGAAATIDAGLSRAEIDFDRGAIAAVHSTFERVVGARPGSTATLAVARLIGTVMPGPSTGGADATRTVSMRAENLTGDGIAGSALGNEVALFTLDADLRGAIPDGPARVAAAGWRDRGGLLDIDHVGVRWGALRARGTGTLTLDKALRPFGAFALRVAGYDGVVDQLVARRQIRPEDAGLVRGFLAALAAQKGDGDGVPVPLHVQNGHVWLGWKAIADVAPLF